MISRPAEAQAKERLSRRVGPSFPVRCTAYDSERNRVPVACWSVSLRALRRPGRCRDSPFHTALHRSVPHHRKALFPLPKQLERPEQSSRRTGQKAPVGGRKNRLAPGGFEARAAELFSLPVFRAPLPSNGRFAHPANIFAPLRLGDRLFIKNRFACCRQPRFFFPLSAPGAPVKPQKRTARFCAVLFAVFAGILICLPRSRGRRRAYFVSQSTRFFHSGA